MTSTVRSEYKFGDYIVDIIITKDISHKFAHMAFFTVEKKFNIFISIEDYANLDDSELVSFIEEKIINHLPVYIWKTQPLYKWAERKITL